MMVVKTTVTYRHFTVTIKKYSRKIMSAANQQYPSRLFRLAFDGGKNGTGEVRSL
jgi:hypothetical protein